MFIFFFNLKEVEDTSDKYYTIAPKSEEQDSHRTFAKKGTIVEEGIKAGERLAAKVYSVTSQCL
jgi:hypothetical protein